MDERIVKIMGQIVKEFAAKGLRLEDAVVPPMWHESYGLTVNGRLIHVKLASCTVGATYYEGTEVYPQEGRAFRHHTGRDVLPGGELGPAGGQPFVRAWVLPRKD